MKSAPCLRVHNQVTGKCGQGSSVLCRTTTLDVRNSVDILAARASDDGLRRNEETVEHRACNTTVSTLQIQINPLAPELFFFILEHPVSKM